MLPDDAVPGPTEVPSRSEEEDGVRSGSSSSAGAVLRGRAAPAALHCRDEDEEQRDEGQTQEPCRSHLIRSQVRFFPACGECFLAVGKTLTVTVSDANAWTFTPFLITYSSSENPNSVIFLFITVKLF